MISRHPPSDCMLYFAYGSNMSHRRLQQRVPSACCVCVADLAEHALRFHKRGRDDSGKCDAFFTGRPHDRVIGVVFEIAIEEKAGLDRVEGLGKGYEQKSVSVISATHGPLQAFTYYATAIDRSLAPYHWYKEHVLRGCRQNRLPADYLQEILTIPSVEDPDSARSQMESALYRR